MEKIRSIVVNNIGGNTNFAVNSNLDASGQANIAGDWESLAKVLGASGLDKQDVDGLREAMAVDGDNPGNCVMEWVKENASKVVTGGVKIGATVGAEVLSALIRKHYGIS